jgi:hypothetical protein
MGMAPFSNPPVVVLLGGIRSISPAFMAATRARWGRVLLFVSPFGAPWPWPLLFRLHEGRPPAAPDERRQP